MLRKFTFLVLFLFAMSVQAADFTGTWFMKASGYPFILNIVQTGNSITGTMTYFINGNVDNITGTVSDRNITFTRLGQQYSGYLFTFNNGLEDGVQVAGLLKNPGTDWIYGWYALKQL